MANSSRVGMLLAVVVCACGALASDDAYKQLDTKIQTTVDAAIKQQFESDLNTQITKLIDERLPVTVTPQVEDTFQKQQSKIVDEVLKIVNSQDEGDSSDAVDAERLASAEAAAKAAEAQVTGLLKRIDALEGTLQAERTSTEKFTSSARQRIDSISALITTVQGEQQKQDAAIKQNKEADEKLKKQTTAASAGGVTQEQVQETVNTEFGVLKKITDAADKTIHTLHLKIGELKTIIDNPTNGVQGAVQSLADKMKRFQGELDDVRNNVVRQQFKENRDLVNKNTKALDKATSTLTKQQSKLDLNAEADGKLKKAYEKEKKRLNDLITSLTNRLTKLESESGKNSLEKYWTMTKEGVVSTYNKLYKDVYVEHVKNFDSKKFHKAVITNTQAFADWSWKSSVALGNYIVKKASEITASARKFLGEFYKDFEPRARNFLKNASAQAADLTNKAMKNAGPAMQEAQRLAVVYAKKSQELAVLYYGEGVVLYNKVHKEAVQQFIDMKLAAEQAVLAATVVLVSVLAIGASIVLFAVYKTVKWFFSLIFGSCCRSSKKKSSSKKAKKREEAGGAEDSKANAAGGGKNAGSGRKKKGKKGQRGKYDTL